MFRDLDLYYFFPNGKNNIKLNLTLQFNNCNEKKRRISYYLIQIIFHRNSVEDSWYIIIQLQVPTYIIIRGRKHYRPGITTLNIRLKIRNFSLLKFRLKIIFCSCISICMFSK